MFKKYLLPALLLLLIAVPLMATAQKAGFLSAVSSGKNSCLEAGNCTICEIIGTALYIFKWAMGMLGGAALLLFVWHGFSMVISGGEAEKVKKARDGLAHTLIGLAIVFGSWLIVNLVIVTLANPDSKASLIDGGIGTIFDGQTAWNAKCELKK